MIKRVKFRYDLKFTQFKLQNTILCHVFLQPLRLLTKALLYSVAVCYHARLSNRKAFEDGITRAFPEPYAIPHQRGRFIDEVHRYVIRPKFTIVLLYQCTVMIVYKISCKFWFPMLMLDDFFTSTTTGVYIVYRS